MILKLGKYNLPFSWPVSLNTFKTVERHCTSEALTEGVR